MSYIPETYTITKSEVMHLHSTLEEAMTFYEMYTSKPSDTADNEMGWRVWDCKQAQDIVRNLESDETQYSPSIKEANSAIHTETEYVGDTDYFD